jgi:hypothetical protein
VKTESFCLLKDILDECRFTVDKIIEGSISDAKIVDDFTAGNISEGSLLDANIDGSFTPDKIIEGSISDDDTIQDGIKQFVIRNDATLVPRYR